MIPLRDVNPTSIRPLVNWAVIALAAYAFFFVQPHAPREATEFVYRHAAIPCEVTSLEPLSPEEIRRQACTPGDGAAAFPGKSIVVSLFASMFLHANLLHILGNMWSLWVFGNNVEDAYGHLGFLALYLLSGLAATLAFVLLRPDSTIPLVGASGAIAGIMGAYLVLYPGHLVVTVIPLFIIPWVVAVPAALFLAIWFLGQFLLAGQATGIAWEAHVAGFLFGALVSLLLRSPLLRRVRQRRRALAFG